ncbi:hypothetical protein ACFRAO_19945 [Streptomyces sp. NPDC056656]|uniref:hypothetical protein n=1 Tax=Streptomyces sp. NPDC056656 TaxID=3345895 RepID=UPI003683F411
MRHHLGSLLRRTAVGVISLASISATRGAAAAAPAREAESIAFTQRYRALQHGGVVRAANAAISCRTAAAGAKVSCPAARSGRAAANGDFDMSSISEPGRAQPRRVPAYANTLGYDSDVFALGRSIGQRGPGLDLRLASRRDTAWIGVLLAAVDARP